ncbi:MULTISPECIES: transposase [Psychrilyobacter]|uniref:Transposase n=1 Tax=Psychrilyobacter piezotolerans TaxID=2293438 RepID=A0ABX9KDQ3_9FUSO|nr:MULTISPECIES: transposase [Psychrilyobacter]MCS5422426.1 transposase [Psychrilyobacter sp. S5]NDI79058.1 transposase [Psychrilyobacter piezotolerans]RDE59019.1 transposase [Psychrilyobacter sp. S5]REI39596.1 transposase [Psychrilyobacter piezotolerans]
MSEKYNKYSKETKLKAVKKHLNDGFSYQTIANEMNIKSKTQVKKFKELGDTAFDTENRGRTKGVKKRRTKNNFSSLEEEVEYLRMEVEYLKKLKKITGR